MLLNEFLKAHRKIDEQERKIEQLKSTFQSTVAQQQKEIALLAVSLKAQAAQLQKVSDRVEVSQAAPRIVSGN